MAKWTGKVERELRVWNNPKLTDDIYLHFSEILEKVKFYALRFRGKVLDVGAGKSPYRQFFRNASEYIRLDNYDYEGIDIKADITKGIPLKSNSVDGVVCFQVIEHVMAPGEVVDEIYRVAKKGSPVLLTTNMAVPLHGEPYDYYRFTKYALSELFKKFRHVEIKPNGGSVLSIIQLIVWGISEKAPSFLAKPLIVAFNSIGRKADKIMYNDKFTLNYSVFAVK
jgi:SAM-dependent methyltransferase